MELVKHGIDFTHVSKKIFVPKLTHYKLEFFSMLDTVTILVD